MGLFEQNPLLMLPFILLVVAAYDGAKWLVRHILQGDSLPRRQRLP